MIQFRKGYKYQLANTYFIQTKIRLERSIDNDYIRLDHNGLLTIAKGYAWDGASGPALDTPSFMRGSLVHDALYQLIKEDVLFPQQEMREYADSLLIQLCKEDGMGWFRRQYVWAAVRWFGDNVLESGPREIITAP